MRQGKGTRVKTKKDHIQDILDNIGKLNLRQDKEGKIGNRECEALKNETHRLFLH